MGKIANSRVLFGTFNVIFLVSGLLLLIFGFLVLCDTPRVLLSRLLTSPDSLAPQPPFYYVALGLVGGGLLMCAGGSIGCWATYSRGYCVLTIYVILVLLVLLLQCTACVIVVGWPNCVGLGTVRGGAVGALQAGYGVPGQEQFTAALDLAQTTFKCCGMTDSRNYDMSLWQLRRLGPRDLIVPLTCCVQIPDEMSYLDPKPLNQSVCQELLPEHFTPHRHGQGCLAKVEIWYQQQYITFLAVLLVMALCEFGVLLSAVLACTQLKKDKIENNSFDLKHSERMNSTLNNRTNENIYQNKSIRSNKPPEMDFYIQPEDYYSPRTRNTRSHHYLHGNKDEMA